MKKFIIALLFVSSSSLACINDFDCGYGNKCVKPQGSYSMNGVCVQRTNDYGNQDYSDNSYAIQPRQISRCSFNTDCEMGATCLKESGQIYGICVK